MFGSHNNPVDPIVNNKTAAVKGQHQQGPQGTAAAAAPAGLKVRERKFENGDRYRGGWLNGLVSNHIMSRARSQTVGMPLQLGQAVRLAEGCSLCCTASTALPSSMHPYYPYQRYTASALSVAVLQQADAAYPAWELVLWVISLFAHDVWYCL